MPSDLRTSVATVTRDLKGNVTSGLGWSAVGRVGQQVMQFGLSVVMARLLSPKDYGIMAMSMVFTGFAAMLADAGFNTAIVQRKELKESHTHTVFWMTFGSGLALTLLTFVLSPWLADFFKAPPLKPIFRIIALNFTFGGIGNVPSALLQRRMQFRTIAKIDVISLAASGIIGVVMAFEGAGVWSLVGQSISASLLTSIFRCISCRWHPKAIFCRLALKEIWSFSGSLYGFNFINYWARNADNLVVGKFFGAPALGIYNRSYALMLLPITQINGVISQVVLPAFSGIQDDKERVKRLYLRTLGVVSLIGFPIMTGLAVTAVPFVNTVYGERWNEVAVLLQILAIAGIIQVVVNTVGWIYVSQGDSRTMFFMGSIGAIMAIGSFALGVLFGTVRALAVCYAICNALYFYPALAVAGRVINLKASQILTAVAGPFCAALVMAGVVYSVGKSLPTNWFPWQILMVMTGIGVLVYGFIVYSFKLPAWQEVLNLLLERIKPKAIVAT